MLGKIIFISGPSGVGKGTVISALRDRHPEWIFPPSCTTRDPRPGEKEGETYFYISREEFEKRIEEGAFLEYAEVHHGNLYGTLKAPLIDGVEQGKIVVREFDVQGFEQARERLSRDYYFSIFIKPAEDIETLVRRIRERDGTISDEEIERRVESMKKELSLEHLYDATVISVDEEIDRMIEDTEKIIAEKVGRGDKFQIRNTLSVYSQYTF
ncbi:guanylate kinase [Candidatus Gracilibacteria bacterium]|nr:guanylate kinase [Candidatus Gracilibacteria bacterium]